MEAIQLPCLRVPEKRVSVPEVAAFCNLRGCISNFGEDLRSASILVTAQSKLALRQGTDGEHRGDS